MTNKLTLHERQEQVHDLLRPDEIRRHRVAEGLPITNEQAEDLAEKARTAAIFAKRMSCLSNTALTLDALDPESRVTRSLLGTEPLFQARKRGEQLVEPLNEATITKVDLVLTPDGFSIVEIEPGKVRGLGYGRMVREQASAPVGIGSEEGLGSITNNSESMIALSEQDRFHIPELNILGRFVGGLSVINQHELIASGKPQTILASPFKGSMSGRIEETLRTNTVIVSDRRPDIESKGNLAIVHNTGENPELEKRLQTVFSDQELVQVRGATPRTHHSRLLTSDQRDTLRNDFMDGSIKLFAKPLSDSGTRGIITPSDITALRSILARPRNANSFALQEAAQTVPQTMESLDIMSGEHSTDEMNIRVTLHVDRDGNIIEASVVGSPHEHLAHGGKTSVITNLELE